MELLTGGGLGKNQALESVVQALNDDDDEGNTRMLEVSSTPLSRYDAQFDNQDGPNGIDLIGLIFDNCVYQAAAQMSVDGPDVAQTLAAFKTIRNDPW